MVKSPYTALYATIGEQLGQTYSLASLLFGVIAVHVVVVVKMQGSSLVFKCNKSTANMCEN